MIMEDRKQVVPKVPNAKAGQESQDQPTNASEVATMEFGKLTTYFVTNSADVGPATIRYDRGTCK